MTSSSAESALHEPEGARVPPGHRVVDTHVHLFPPRVFQAIWRWFDTHGWPIRYPLPADQVIDFLQTRGVARIVGLAYAHVPGMSEDLNAFMADLQRQHPDFLLGLGTVLPGEPDDVRIVERAFDHHGLAGLKLHCHVQCFAPDEPRLDPIYAAAARHHKPIVIHSGREPKPPTGLRCDPHQLCSADAVDRVLSRHPDLTLVVPHLGAGEIDEYAALLDAHPNLYLDTTMLLAGYFEYPPPWELLRARPERILYGTDFPNLPYAWDRELRHLLAADLPTPAREAILSGTARRVWGL